MPLTICPHLISYFCFHISCNFCSYHQTNILKCSQLFPKGNVCFLPHICYKKHYKEMMCCAKKMIQDHQNEYTTRLHYQSIRHSIWNTLQFGYYILTTCFVHFHDKKL